MVIWFLKFQTPWKAQAEAQQLLERIKNKTREMRQSQQLDSSLSPLGVSLMPVNGLMQQNALATVQESSIQSYTNETQQLMALR